MEIREIKELIRKKSSRKLDEYCRKNSVGADVLSSLKGFASDCGNARVMSVMSEFGVSFAGCDSLTCSIWAAKRKNASTLEYLVSVGLGAEESKDGETALHYLASGQEKDSELALMLIRSGVSPHKKNNEGETPLYLLRRVGELSRFDVSKIAAEWESEWERHLLTSKNAQVTEKKDAKGM